MTRALALILFTVGVAGAVDVPFPIVGTGQSRCYDDRNEIAPPQPGQPFSGQDAQQKHSRSSYKPGADGLTVRDNITGLTWQRSPDTNGDAKLNRGDKLTLAQALALPGKLNAAKFGGFDDWRWPAITELYSLFDARGADPSGPSDADTSSLTPFIDTKFFQFAYWDTGKGERTIDSQYASSTKYVGKGARGFDKLFGVNFADGRIKGYDLMMPGGREEKTFFVQCVRGNPGYGKNDFRDNGDGTVTDRATGLMWSKADSGAGMNWRDALAWVQKMNAEKFLGRDDWQLPDVKELQSIVDYTRSPDTTRSAHPFDIILGRPEADSVTASVLCYENADGFIAYGTEPGKLTAKTPAKAFKNGEPAEILLLSLQPDTRYYYRLHFGQSTSPEFSFQTARPPGKGFTFTVTADSHLDSNTDPDLYQNTLANALADKPDFHIDLGDTFMSEKHENREAAARQYLAQRFYLGQICNAAPLFFVLGNHDGESPRWLGRVRAEPPRLARADPRPPEK
jgi:hypothetical protein